METMIREPSLSIRELIGSANARIRCIGNRPNGMFDLLTATGGLPLEFNRSTNSADSVESFEGLKLRLF